MIKIDKVACQCCNNKNAENYIFTFGDDKISVYICKDCLKILRNKIDEELKGDK